MPTDEDRPDAANVEPAEDATENRSHLSDDEGPHVDASEGTDEGIEYFGNSAGVQGHDPGDESVLRYYASRHREQAWVAYEFAADNLGKLMHVPGVGWLYWDGARWAEDTGQAQNAVLATIRRLVPRVFESADKLLLKELRNCQKANAIRGVLQLASTQRGISARAEELDADPYLLNCTNGTLHLKTLELRPHDPCDRITKVCNAAYDATATSALWTSFLDRVLPNESVRAYFQRFCGLSTVGAVIEHIFTIAIGTGRNGKGVAYESVMHALGDYAVVGAPGLFEQMRINPNAPSPAHLTLRGARLVVNSEMEEGTRLASALMKRLTGGDKLTARALHQAPIQFVPSHTSLFVTNHLPCLPANDPAVWARVKVIQFTVTIPDQEQDPHLVEKLRGDAAAILNWMAQGLAAYWSDGLGEPAEVRQATNQYANSQDDVLRFIDAECIESAGQDGDLTSTLHEHYKMWATADGIHQNLVLGRTKFGESLDRLGFSSKKTPAGMMRTGLTVDRSVFSAITSRIVAEAQEAEPLQEVEDTEVAQAIDACGLSDNSQAGDRSLDAVAP